MPTYDTPGVYIEEQTGPGVIAGVGTSTVAFIGPARKGLVREAVRISSYDEFLEGFAVPDPTTGLPDPHIVSPHWFYLSLAVRGFFDHTNPDGLSPWDRVDLTDYSGNASGENIAQGYPDPAAVMAGWMASDGHCANIMNPDNTELGVGYYGDNSYWTQVMGWR